MKIQCKESVTSICTWAKPNSFLLVTSRCFLLSSDFLSWHSIVVSLLFKSCTSSWNTYDMSSHQLSVSMCYYVCCRIHISKLHFPATSDKTIDFNYWNQNANQQKNKDKNIKIGQRAGINKRLLRRIYKTILKDVRSTDWRVRPGHLEDNCENAVNIRCWWCRNVSNNLVCKLPNNCWCPSANLDVWNFSSDNKKTPSVFVLKSFISISVDETAVNVNLNFFKHLRIHITFHRVFISENRKCQWDHATASQSVRYQDCECIFNL